MTLKVACTTTAPKEKLKLFSPKFMHYGNLIQLSICTYQRTRESWETHGESKLGNLNMNHVLTSILPEKNILLSPITPPPPFHRHYRWSMLKGNFHKGKTKPSKCLTLIPEIDLLTKRPTQ